MMRLIILFVTCLMVTLQCQSNELTTGISKFSSELYLECANTTDGNVIISPFSVAAALALLSQATNSSTFEEIRKGLHASGNKSTIANQFSEFHDLLQKGAGQTTFSIANQIYINQNYTISKNIKEVAVDKFRSGIDPLNFDEMDEAAKQINDFVEEKTNHKIRDLIDAEKLSSNTRIVLINAIYFKGDWQYKFNESNTKKGDFYINVKDKVQAEFMYMEQYIAFGRFRDLDAKAIEMKYANSQFSMIIILPNKRTGLSELEAKEINLEKVTSELDWENTQIWIPKFKIEFESSLNNILKNMGMGEMFTQNADITGFSEETEPLYISHSVHKAFIEINEAGAEAAAATGFLADRIVGGEEVIQQFRADHPFMFWILDNSKTAIFSGRVKHFN